MRSDHTGTKLSEQPGLPTPQSGSGSGSGSGPAVFRFFVFLFRRNLTSAVMVSLLQGSKVEPHLWGRRPASCWLVEAGEVGLLQENTGVLEASAVTSGEVR